MSLFTKIIVFLTAAILSTILGSILWFGFIATYSPSVPVSELKINTVLVSPFNIPVILVAWPAIEGRCPQLSKDTRIKMNGQEFAPWFTGGLRWAYSSGGLGLPYRTCRREARFGLAKGQKLEITKDSKISIVGKPDIPLLQVKDFATAPNCFLDGSLENLKPGEHIDGRCPKSLNIISTYTEFIEVGKKTGSIVHTAFNKQRFGFKVPHFWRGKGQLKISIDFDLKIEKCWVQNCRARSRRFSKTYPVSFKSQ